MDNIIIDTNVLYDWIGRESLGMCKSTRNWNYHRMRRILNASGVRRVSINATSIFEALVFHKDNREHIKKICKFIINNHITIIQDYDFKITKCNLLCLHKLTDNKDEKKFINSLIKIKADVEIKYVTTLIVMFTQIYSNLYFQYLESKGVGNLENVKSNWMDLYFLDYKNPIKIVSKAINNEIHEGYKYKKNMGQLIKEIFQRQVSYQTYISISLIDMLIKKPEKTDTAQEWLEINQSQNLYLQNLTSQPDFINKALFDAVDKNCRLKLIDEKKEVFKLFTERQKQYIVNVIFCNFFFGPKKFQKNDILDLKILQGIEEQDTYILTGDNEINNFINEQMPCKLKYLNRLIN